jgi:hypothetical protein
VPVPRRCGLVAGLFIGASVVLTACGGHDPLPCSDIGADSGILISYAGPVPQSARGFAVTACAGDDCRTEHVADKRRATIVGEDLDGPDPVEVRLRIRDAAGRVVFSGHTTVTPQKLQPNGAGCEPTAWVGALVAHGRHTLSTRPGVG